VNTGAKFPTVRLVVIILVLILFAVMFSMGISKEKPVGSVTGKVYDFKNKKPIGGAKVYHPTRNTYVKTDAEGKYIIFGIPENKKGCTIRVYAKGYKYSYRPGVKVSEGKTVENINFKMIRRKSSYNVYAYQKVFAPGKKPTININGYLVKNVKFSIYKIEPLINIDHLTNYRKIKEINVEDKTPITEFIYTSSLNEDGEFDSVVKLNLEDNGIYLIKTRAIGGSLSRTTWVIKSDMGLIVKRSKDNLLIFAQSFTTGKPVPAASLKVYRDGILITKGKTDKDGLFELKRREQKPFQIIANKNDSYAFARTYYGYMENPNKIYMYTDRPVYRPGQNVFFKGINRIKSGFKYEVYDGGYIGVSVNDSRGNKIYTKNIRTNNFGSFDGSFKLDDEAPLGSYSLRARIGERSKYYYFEVSEYKKPEYKIEIAADKPHYVAGDKIRIKVRGKYYFGAPVTNAKFNLTVMESPYYWSRAQWGDYYGDRQDMHGGIMFETGGKLDIKGEAEIVIPTGKVKFNKLLSIEVEATDISGRAVTAKTSVPLSVGEFALYCYPGKYVYSPGEEVNISIEAMDFDEKPVKDQLISILAKKITYKEVREEKFYREGGRRRRVYEYHTRRIETPLGKAVQILTDEKGKAIYKFTPQTEGSFKIEALALDKRRNKIRYSTYTYVASESYGGMMSEADLSIITDKKKYERGDTVKAVITSSKKDVYVLMTIEGRKIYEKKVIHIEGSSKTLNIPLKKEYFPNIFLNVCMIKDMDLVRAGKDIKIDQAEKKLKVTIKPDKKRYHPGDKARYTVEVTDYEGNPVESEFSLGVVDEAVYAIRPDMTPNIHTFFWAYDYNRVDTTISFSRDYSGGPEKDERPQKIRKNFKDTAFWSPVVRTDTNGRAVVEFNLPDNLTTWVATVRAATLNTDVGSAVNFVVSTKDLLVRLETPRFFTQRDILYIGGIVHNYTKKNQRIKVWLEAEGVELKKTEKTTYMLKPEEAKDFYWPVTAKTPGEATLRLLCVGTDADDAMELKVPVHPFGVEEVKADSGVIRYDESEAEIKLSLPGQVIPEVTKMEILLSPSIANTMLENLDYLIHYPYGCVEQTMSSFYPALAAKRVFRLMNIHDEKLERKIPKIVSKSLGKLYEMQHYDGGWGWWKNDKTHPYMTAYVLQGLKEAQKNGYKVSSYSFKRGISALIKMIRGEPSPTATLGGAVIQGEEWNTRVYLLYSLYKIGIAKRDKINEVFKNRKNLNDYGMALLAMTLDGSGESQKALQTMSELDKRAQDDGKDCYWDGRTFTYSWMDNKIETTAYCLQAYVQLRPEDKKIQRIIRWLSKQRKGRGYSSTKDTASVVYAFTSYLLRSGEISPDYDMNLNVNGQTISDYRVNKTALPERLRSLKLDKRQVKTGDNLIKISKTGRGVLYYTVRLRYFLDKPTIEPVAMGMKVSRNYYLISHKKNRKGRIMEITEPLPNRPLKRGEKLRVEVIVEADKDYQYVIIEDPLPAGFEVTISQGERNWGSLWWCRQEIHDEKVSFFSRQLYKGKKMKLSYDIRAEMFGNVNALPTNAYAMYEPEVRGHSASTSLIIEKDNE